MVSFGVNVSLRVKMCEECGKNQNVHKSGGTDPSYFWFQLKMEILFPFV